MIPPGLHDPEEISDRLEQVLATSPADDTEVAWLESVRSSVSTRRRGDESPAELHTSVLVTVQERGRVGLHQTGVASAGELAGAVRQALGRARTDPEGPRPRRLATPRDGGDAGQVAFDPELAALTPSDARERLRSLTDGGEVARLSWTIGHLVIANSRGLRRRVRASTVTLGFRLRGRGGSGRASAAARSLAALAGEEAAERARARHAGGEPVPPPAGPTAVVLAPEAAGRLVELLNRAALSASSFRDGTSFLAGRLGGSVFAADVHLRDDALEPRGLPFPCDLFGFNKRPVDLVDEGVLVTPAVDPPLAARLERPATPHAVDGDEARASNLFLLPGELSDDELLRRAEDGVWVSALERLECFDPPSGRFRALARGARRIASGKLAEPLPALVWEDALERVFAALGGLGQAPVTTAPGDALLGGVSAPALLLPATEGLRSAPPTPRS